METDGMKVLVVDDNEVNTMVVASMLEQYNMLVTECYAGKNAVELAKQEDYDIIFMDYLMPEMNGIVTTEKIRKLGKVKRPVIVVLSANVTQELQDNCTRAGVDDVLEKPLEMEKLCQIVEKWMPDKSLDAGNLEQVQEKEEKRIAAIKEMFQPVEGLDVEKGLSHLANSVENYMKVIEAAVENIRTEKTILSMYQDSQMQPSSLKNSFHSLKGVFLNLGVSHLSERSQMFELACTDQSVELVADHLQQYLEELNEFLEGLEQGLQQYDADYALNMRERYVPISEEEWVQCMTKLIADLKKYAYNDLQELVKKLLYASKGKERECLTAVESAVQNFQYEEALEQLEQLQM